MSDLCPEKGVLVDRELSRIATQYREAKRLRGYMGAVLGQLEDVARVTCDIPNHFDLNTAVGEQLTWIGKRMGVPRCHCVCNTKPIHGYACEGEQYPFPLSGYCEDGTYLGCDGVSTLCLSDDEVFRAHLKARRYQMLGLFDLESLSASIRHVWGRAAWVPQAKRGQVVLSPGRDLSSAERTRLAVTLRILPVAPGMRIAMHFGAAPIAGYGTGWAGYCDESDPSIIGHLLCPVVIDPYACP